MAQLVHASSRSAFYAWYITGLFLYFEEISHERESWWVFTCVESGWNSYFCQFLDNHIKKYKSEIKDHNLYLKSDEEISISYKWICSVFIRLVCLHALIE